MKSRTTASYIAAAVLVLANVQSHGQAVVKDTADVLDQGGTLPAVAEDGATLKRTPNGITVALTMPTPVSGSYDYPTDPSPWQPAPVPGFPEVFSGWAFVFNDPDACAASPCALPTPDFAEGRVGVYNFSGHVSGKGARLNLVGHITTGEPGFDHPNPDANNPLDNPLGAEVHLAIAPHGALLPEHMPDQIRTPVGTPAYWWLSLFVPEQ